MDEPELKTVTDFNGNRVSYNPKYLVTITYGTWKNGPDMGKPFAKIHMISGRTITINIKDNE